MTILKLLNKKNLLILLSLLLLQNVYANEPVDIWNIEKLPSQEEEAIIDEEIESKKNLPSSIIKINDVDSITFEVDQEKDLSSDKLYVAGIFDPSENSLTIDMWNNSNGFKILEIMDKINKINLSKDSKEILNIALLTNSYFPKKNIDSEQFLKIKSDWLLKQKDLDLLEIYLEKNQNLKNQSNLIKFYLDYYLSRSDLNKACKIFDKLNSPIKDNYVYKFKIYCLIDSNKKDEAQLYLDLLKESGFEDKFFEKKFNYLMEYDEQTNSEISEKSLLEFHLSHRTNIDFKFEPKINTSKLIWKYLSSTNLLDSVDLIDLEDNEKIFTIEKATHDKNFSELELFSLYERFIFNVNQLLTAKDTYKLLPKYEARSLIYQRILLTDNTSEKIKLIKILKDLFEEDNISNAFDIRLVKFLESINETEIPSNYIDFYHSYLKNDKDKIKKIKFNNKIIHQSKLLNYFENQSNKKNIEKDLESLLKKIKKDKKYVFSTKDIILVEALKSDGIKVSKKYQNLYEANEANIPYDIQILINNNETGLLLLRLVEIIGEDEITKIGIENLYFIISALNQLDIDKLRNKIILKILPFKV